MINISILKYIEILIEMMIKFNIFLCKLIATHYKNKKIFTQI